MTTTRAGRAPRRTDALTRERIVAAAVELLDTTGEQGLTFRALTERLATGPGAIYWHVANKDELLGAATDAVVTAALPPPAGGAAEDEVRAVALGLFDAIDAHPWLGPQLAVQLARRPGAPLTPRIFESLGRPLRALGVPADAWFTAGSTLMSYVLGAAGQNATNGVAGRSMDAGRTAFLDTAASAWEALDPDEYPVTHAVAAQLRDHDDREQYLAGVDVVLAGIRARYGGTP